MKKLDKPRPCVVRLLGTNMEEARRLLTDSGMPFELRADFAEAASAVVAQVPK